MKNFLEVSADIPANPVNVLLEQLQRREEQLKARELELEQARPAADLNSYLLIILIAAVAVNFYWDYRQSKKL